MPTPVPITVAHGDGIGPEIMAATLHILKEAGAALEIDTIEVGEKVYLTGNTSGIAPSSWDSLRPHQGVPEGPRSPLRRAAATRASTSPRARCSACTPTSARACRITRSFEPSTPAWTW
jgi:isocitrate/isopropylmalate dehydrogenase